MGGLFSRPQQQEGEQQPLAPNRNRAINQTMTGTVNNPNSQGVQDNNQNGVPDVMENQPSANQMPAQEGGKRRRRATPAKRKAVAPKKKTKAKAKPKAKPAQKKTSRSKSRA